MAGQKGTIMIATNMAGRGTDILLGEGVSELGGLHIIGTERHESRRIDNQLRGRAGRQGDPGSSQFILSLEDELFSKMDKEEIDKWIKKAETNSTGEVIKPEPLKFVNKVQLSIEGIFYSAREHLLKVDNVSDQQRKVVYALRNRILDEPSVYPLIQVSTKEYATHVADAHCVEELPSEDWDVNGLRADLQTIFPEQTLTESTFNDMEKEEIQETIDRFLAERNRLMERLAEEENTERDHEVKGFILRSLDTLWLRHLETMNFIKEGMHLKSYSQEDPYRMFEKDAYDAFLGMHREWNQEITIQFATVVQYSQTELTGGQ